jgi:hypothetical protein
MDDLDKLLEGYTTAFMKYPEERRAIEAKFMRAVVAEIKALKAAGEAPRYWTEADMALASIAAGNELKPLKRGPGRPPKQEAV